MPCYYLHEVSTTSLLPQFPSITRRISNFAFLLLGCYKSQQNFKNRPQGQQRVTPKHWDKVHIIPQAELHIHLSLEKFHTIPTWY